MKKFVTTLTLTAVLFIGGCGTGKQLGIGWTTHNTTTAIITELNEQKLVPLSFVKEFRSYQVPVNAGLNNATDSYLEGDLEQTDLILDMLEPMLDRMIKMSEEGDSK